MRLIRKKINLKIKNLHSNLSFIKNKIHSRPSNKKRVSSSSYKGTYKIPNKIKRNTCITYITPPSSFLLNTPSFSSYKTIPSTPLSSTSTSSISSSDTNPFSLTFIKNTSTDTSFLFPSSSSNKYSYKQVYNFKCNSSSKRYSNKKLDLIKKKERIKIFPHVFIEGYYFCIDYIKVNLQKYPTTLKLIKSFFHNGSLIELTRENLIQQVYDEAKYLGSSKREECLSSNLIKLISRTRTLIKEAMREEYKYIDWLYYDSTNKKWELYTLQKEYLVIKEAKFKNLVFNINTLNHYCNVKNVI